MSFRCGIKISIKAPLQADHRFIRYSYGYAAVYVLLCGSYSHWILSVFSYKDYNVVAGAYSAGHKLAVSSRKKNEVRKTVLNCILKSK